MPTCHYKPPTPCKILISFVSGGTPDDIVRSMRRVHSLKNTFSGVAAEARVAAEMVRCGLRVAKPYWTDDECDLIILTVVDNCLIPIPVQVKAVQFLESKSREVGDDRFVPNLKKRYVERSAALCLAIYRPDLDKMWFIDGAKNIRATYDEGAKAGKQRPYVEIPSNGDVPIRVTYEECFLDRDWLVPEDDSNWLSDRVARIARALATEQDRSAQISGLLDAVLPEYDDEDNGVFFGDSDSIGGGAGS